MICKSCLEDVNPIVYNAWDSDVEEAYQVFKCPECGEESSEEGELFE